MYATADSSLEWTIAAEKFSFTNERTASKSDDALLSVMPRLILEQLAENLERTPTAVERLDRTTYTMQRERIDLFLQLSREVQVRDSYVAGNYSEKQLNSLIRDADKKIEELKKQIDASLIEEAAERKKALPIIEEESSSSVDREIVKIEKTADMNRTAKKKSDLHNGAARNEQSMNERVHLYKNDFTVLFTVDDDVQKAGYESRQFENAVVDAKINALITGHISSYGGYISATVSLIVFPGVKIIDTVTDIGNVQDIRSLAVHIARQLTPSITNSMPVELFFDVQPQDAAENITLMVDDIVYRAVPERLVIDAGVHSILFSAPGFKQAGTSYGFRGHRSFKVHAELAEESDATLSLRLKKPLFGTIYANGVEASTLNEDNQIITLTINDEPVLGQFITEDGSAASFYVAYKLLENNASLLVNMKPFDRSAYIDKRRKAMYVSYSILITSLLATFYTYGSFHSQNIAAANGYVSVANAQAWYTASWISIGVTASCGAWFIFELVRYFIAADKVLPSQARVQKVKRNEHAAVQESEQLLHESDNQETAQEIVEEQ
ncbi:MAG: hypothetical protein J6I73_03165 [Treponema sp.]|nr:hypothetical protein [Treponema sp.]